MTTVEVGNPNDLVDARRRCKGDCRAVDGIAADWTNTGGRRFAHIVGRAHWRLIASRQPLNDVVGLVARMSPVRSLDVVGRAVRSVADLEKSLVVIDRIGVC